MLDELMRNIYVQAGAFGLFVAALILANLAQWKQGIKERGEHRADVHEFTERSIEVTAALVELSVLTRDRK